MLQRNMQEGHPGTCAEGTRSFKFLLLTCCPFPEGSDCLACHPVPHDLAVPCLGWARRGHPISSCQFWDLLLLAASHTAPRETDSQNSCESPGKLFYVEKNTSENGYIINGPAVSTIKS